MILSEDSANQVPYPKPPRYDLKRYEFLAHPLEAMTRKRGRPPIMNEVYLIARIPNRKADINNNGPLSTDYIWPKLGVSRRRLCDVRIRKEHFKYVKGFFYYLAHEIACARLRTEKE